MPFGMGPYYAKPYIWDGLNFFSLVVLLLLITLGIVMFLIFRQINSENLKLKEEIIKLQKDIEELKELVKDLKKKWEEIE